MNRQNVHSAAGRGAVLILALLIAVVHGLHLAQLNDARKKTREALSHTLQQAQLASSERTLAVDAFDRATRDLYLAATPPYVLLAAMLLFLLVQMSRLNRRLLAVEAAVIESSSLAVAHWRSRN